MPRITVSSVAYVHDDDVDIEERTDARVLDQKTDLCVVRATNALEKPITGYNDLHRGNISFILTSMQATHRAMKKVLGFGPDKPESIDAMVLARVCLEGLYTLCLMFEDPLYVDCYLRDGWRKAYVKFILQREETKKLPRFDEYSKNIAPTYLTQLRDLFGITEAQQRTIDHDELGTPLLPTVKADRIRPFPTPGRIIEKLPHGDRRRMLERLYFEYQRLSSFAHGLPEANLFKEMSREHSPYNKLFDKDKIRETRHREIEEQSWIVSRLSIVQAVAELTLLYPGDVELCAAAIDAWQEFSDGILLSRLIWNIRTKRLLGIIN